MANMPKRVIRGKDVVKGLKKPKEFNNKPMRVKIGKEEVNGLGRPRNKVVIQADMTGMLANKSKRGKDVESGPRKPYAKD